MSKVYLITGGAGFIGTNYTMRLLNRGEQVIIYDNLSRKGAKLNLDWLKNQFGDDSFRFFQNDIRNLNVLQEAVNCADVIIHLAAQVAVTSSVVNPREDFEINALGTFNVMEAARLSKRNPIVIFSSTNKVYGCMDDLIIEEKATRYAFSNLPYGVSEERSLDFHSPYGCSKGCGDQYVRDYSRIYQIPAVVFRQSCIYGPHQFGIEDQGWVAWFVISANLNRPITIFGDGKQVRDLLHVDDLLNAYDYAIERIDHCSGKIFNIGGGIENTLSIWKEFQPLLEGLISKSISVNHFGWRQGDQRVYISDIRKAQEILNWHPKINAPSGIELLNEWIQNNLSLFG